MAGLTGDGGGSGTKKATEAVDNLGLFDENTKPFNR